jgi:hypothetical protein
MKFRVKQICENKYIPQVRNNLFGSWYGIDNIWNDTWYDKTLQTKYCSKPTLSDALLEIDIWKTKIHKKRNYPIYHKIKNK